MKKLISYHSLEKELLNRAGSAGSGNRHWSRGPLEVERGQALVHWMPPRAP